MSSIALRKATELGANIPGSLQATFVRMACYANDDGGSCYPSNAALARETGHDLRTVRRHKRKLEAGGWIVRSDLPGKRGGRRKPDCYRLLLDPKNAAFGPGVSGHDTGHATQPSRKAADTHTSRSPFEQALSCFETAFEEKKRRPGALKRASVEALAGQVAEVAKYTLDLCDKDLAAVFWWKNRLCASDDLILRVIEADRAKPNPKPVVSLNFFTHSIELAVAREKVTAARKDEAVTTMTPPAPVVVSAPSPLESVSMQPLAEPEPSDDPTLAELAMTWARMTPRPPIYTERSIIQNLLDEGATAELFQSVIESIAGRAAYTPPCTLMYFEEAIRDELESPVRGRRLWADWKPSPKGEAFARDLGYNPDDQAAAFRRHHLTAGKLMVDWEAAFRLWCLRRTGWDRADAMISRDGIGGGGLVINAATEPLEETNSVPKVLAMEAANAAEPTPQPVAAVPSPLVTNTEPDRTFPYGRIVAALANRGKSGPALPAGNAGILSPQKEDILSPDSVGTEGTQTTTETERCEWGESISISSSSGRSPPPCARPHARGEQNRSGEERDVGGVETKQACSRKGCGSGSLPSDPRPKPVERLLAERAAEVRAVAAEVGKALKAKTPSFTPSVAEQSAAWPSLDGALSSLTVAFAEKRRTHAAAGRPTIVENKRLGAASALVQQQQATEQSGSTGILASSTHAM
jgi:hypothetical protein